MRSAVTRAERVRRRIPFVPLALAFVLSSLAAPPAVDAQRPEKLYRIGMLERTSTAINAANLAGFRLSLRELGYVEGRTFVIEYRSTEAKALGLTIPPLLLLRADQVIQ